MKNRKIGRTVLAVLLVAITLLGATPLYTAALSAGDVNGDGSINLLDVSLLLKHIAGWNDLEPIPEVKDELDLEGVTAINYNKIKNSYDKSYGSGTETVWLTSFYEEPYESFLGFCKYHEDEGFDLYSYEEMNGNHFATYIKGKKLYHIYWIECESELNVAYSYNCGEAMPPKTPAVTTGEYKTSVTQLQSSAYNGMGYVIQLADGSFILYDGGLADSADEMWNTLVKLKGDEEDIMIRTWVITHSHVDHYQCFSEFSKKYADKVTLEHLMISPVNKNDTDGDTYLHYGVKEDVKNFEGAKTLYVHTGMVFSFCNVKLEILLAPEELYIADPRYGSELVNLIDFNSSSIVSRVCTDSYSALFLGDATNHVAYRMIMYYGDYLKSDMCQAAHHGFESFPLIGYSHIRASVMWYPTTQACYDFESPNDFSAERKAIRNSKYTKEIIVHDKSRETRYFPE